MSEVKKIKILVLGADGMLGHKFVECLMSRHQVKGTVRRKEPETNREIGYNESRHLMYGINADNYRSIERVMTNFKPNFVINCIGLTKSLCNDSSRRDAIYLNSLFPHLLLASCQNIDAKLIQFSSDCVFTGESGKYKEDSIADANDLYGASKALGEVFSDDCLTIRKSTIGLELNTNHGLIEWFLRAKGSIKGYSNAIYSGLTSAELVKVVEFIICRKDFISGLIHIASAPISKYSLLKKLSNILGRQDIEIIEDKHFICDRSLNGSKFFEKTQYEIPSWNNMLHDLAKEIKARGFN